MNSPQKQSGDDFHLQAMAGFSPQRTQRCQSGQLIGSQIYKTSGYPMKPIPDIKVCTTSFEFDEAQQNLHQGSLSPSGIYDFSPLVISQDIHLSNIAQQTWDSEILTHSDSMDAVQLFTSPISSRSRSKKSSYSDASIHMSPSSSAMTRQSNSPESLRLLTPIQMDMQPFENFQLSTDTSVFQRDSHGNVTSLHTDGTYSTYGTSGSESFTPLDVGITSSTGPIMYDYITPTDSSSWRKGIIKESPTSSPLLEAWNFSQSILDSDSLKSNFDTIIPREQKISLALHESTPVPNSASGKRSDISMESYRTNGRQYLEVDNTARDHPLYHNVAPQADGMYHCPWENDPGSNCQHKPEKLKCNYDKCVDSHLKPYRCKVYACKDLHFSSTACLLRHEREAHAMHGHGDKPFLCPHEGCERGIPGKGFPRHWNLRDHQKRVHNDPGQTKLNALGTTSPPPTTTKARKRKTSNDITSSSKRLAVPQTISSTKELCLVERYNEKQQLLLKIAGQLEDHKNCENLALLRKANDCIKVMVQTHQRMNSIPISDKPTG